MTGGGVKCTDLNALICEKNSSVVFDAVDTEENPEFWKLGIPYGGTVKEGVRLNLDKPGFPPGFRIGADSGRFDMFIHFIGNIPNFSKLTELSRSQWDSLVDRFINNTAVMTQAAIDSYSDGEGSDDPRKLKDVKGRIVIIGPALPTGKKISGHERAKVEVFRGALRPFVTTVNQELSDVLKSNIRVFLILPGTVDGKEPSNENIVNTINYLMSDEAASSSEVIFCPDETR